MSFDPDDRRWIGDLVMATVDQVQRRNPAPVYKPGKVLVNATNSVKGLAVQLDDSLATVYGDNVTGQPLLQGERVIVMLGANTCLIVGRWVAPHIPHSMIVRKFNPNTNTNSGTYAAIANVNTIAFTKYRTDTKLQLDIAIQGHYVSSFGGAPTGDGAYAVQVNSVDYECCLDAFSTLDKRQSVAGFNEVPAGLAAGTYTCTLRYRAVNAGLGVPILIVDAESTVMFRVTELGSQ